MRARPTIEGARFRIRGGIDAAVRWSRTASMGSLLLTSVVIVNVVLLVQLLVLIHYLQVDATTSLLYAGDETWCSPTQGHIGRHCFGDANLGAVVFRSDPWDKQAWNYLAASMVPSWFFLGIGNLVAHPTVGIVLYIATMAIGMTLPAIWAARGRPVVLKAVIWSAFGFLSIPALWAIDRGNVVGFAVAFMFLAVVALARDQMLLASIGIALAAGAKPQFGLAILAFLFLARWRWFFIGCGIAALTQLIPFLLWPAKFPGTIVQGLQGMIGFGGFDTIDVPIPISVSWVKAGYLIDEWFVRPFTGGGNWVKSHQMLIAVVAVVALTAVVWFTRKSTPPALMISLLFVISALAVPTSFPYYFIAMLPLAAVVLRDPRRDAVPEHGGTVFRGVLELRAGRTRAEFLWSLLLVATLALTVSRLFIPKPIPSLPFYYFTTADFTTLLWAVVIPGYLIARWLAHRRSFDAGAGRGTPADPATAV